jgi:hypothetical protein
MAEILNNCLKNVFFWMLFASDDFRRKFAGLIFLFSSRLLRGKTWNYQFLNAVPGVICESGWKSRQDPLEQCRSFSTNFHKYPFFPADGLRPLQNRHDSSHYPLFPGDTGQSIKTSLFWLTAPRWVPCVLFRHGRYRSTVPHVILP